MNKRSHAEIPEPPHALRAAPYDAHITRAEWRRVLIYGALLLALTLIPYALGRLNADDDYVFSGFLFGVEDGNSYLGKMRLGVQGHWAFSLFYTPEAHDPAPLLFLHYILPGQIIGLWLDAGDPALPGVMLGVFHLLRLAFGLALVLMLYRFAAAFLISPRARFLALILATLGGGFGQVPPEFYIPEWFTFFTLLSLPHLALARTMLLGGLLLLLAGLARGRAWPYAPLAGLCWLVMGSIVPFYAAVGYALLGVWGLVLWARGRSFPWALLRAALIVASITGPLFAHHTLIFLTNPAFATWAAQSVLESPPPIAALLAYLPLGALAWVGGRLAWARAAHDPRWALLIGWPLATPFMVYLLPASLQRRMGEGVIVPLALLAALGVMVLARRWSRRAALPLVAATTFSSILLLGSVSLVVFSTRPPTMNPRVQIEALQWLEARGPRGAVVLGAYDSGNILPVYTNFRPFLGLGTETLDSDAKREQVARFFGGAMDPAERAALYATYDIRYITYGPAERALAGDDTAPAWADDAVRIHEAGDYAIYEPIGR